MDFNSRIWLRISLFNLCIVAFLGLLMRYKIGFEFPYFNQTNLQHSHSHFAFLGWVSQTIMVLMLQYLKNKNVVFNTSRYNKILVANLASSYGMMVFFIVQGYGPISILFSVASIIVAFIFGYWFWKEIHKIDRSDLSRNWFRVAIVFNVLSSVGTFMLAYMMATKTISEALYLASIYFYLHFQYNGWFFFACMGLLYGWLNIRSTSSPLYKTCFLLFAAAGIPAYFLSTLWLNLPLWLYVLTVCAAVIQVVAWFVFLFVLQKEKRFAINGLPPVLRYILLFVVFALTVKLLLQLGSVVPAMSKLAFGFRPIVIAYLHLVLLAVISLFLLFYVFGTGLIALRTSIKRGLALFATAVLLNEIVLGLQGVGALSYTVIPYSNEMLFGIAVLLLSGIGIVAVSSLNAPNKTEV